MNVTILHYTALPVVGGVELVAAYQARELAAAGNAVTVLAGRGGAGGMLAQAGMVVVPELDSQHPVNLEIARALERGEVPPEFDSQRARIVDALGLIVAESDVLIAHNVFNLHLNLPLVAALHDMLDRGALPCTVAWCHDVSRYVNPASGAPQRTGFPWDLLRAYRPEVTYVAVSRRRRQALAAALGCAPTRIHVVPNGVDLEALLGLSAVTRGLVAEWGLLGADLIALMPVRITRAKNIEYGLRVTAVLKAAGIRPRLLVTGPPDPHSPDGHDYWRELLALPRELGLDRDVVFAFEGTPRMPAPLALDAQIVAELYRVCDVVLMTSRREGFGLPVLEGGLVGKPVFSTPVPALDEIPDGSVHVIGWDDGPERAAAAILGWARRDAAYRLRWRVRRNCTWPVIFRRRILPLIAGPVSARVPTP